MTIIRPKPPMRRCMPYASGIWKNPPSPSGNDVLRSRESLESFRRSSGDIIPTVAAYSMVEAMAYPIATFRPFGISLIWRMVVIAPVAAGLKNSHAAAATPPNVPVLLKSMKSLVVEVASRGSTPDSTIARYAATRGASSKPSPIDSRPLIALAGSPKVSCFQRLLPTSLASCASVP